MTRAHCRGLGGAALFAAAVLATAVLWIVSRGKWSDAIIDSGTEWIHPDALARGEMLYRDDLYWFGPFTPYFQAAVFRLFGSSFATLAVCGLAVAAGVLAALYFALRRVTDRCEALLWTALAIPALVFMPNSGGAILGMGNRIWHAAGFALLSCGLASIPGSRRNGLRCLGAGVCAGLAGLCRTEWGVIALVSALAATWVRLPFTARLRRRRPARQRSCETLPCFWSGFPATLPRGPSWPPSEAGATGFRFSCTRPLSGSASHRSPVSSPPGASATNGQSTGSGFSWQLSRRRPFSRPRAPRRAQFSSAPRPCSAWRLWRPASFGAAARGRRPS